MSGLRVQVAAREVEGVVMNKEVAQGLYEDYVARGKTVAKMSSDQDSCIQIILGQLLPGEIVRIYFTLT